jgi:hypothetical protein
VGTTPNRLQPSLLYELQSFRMTLLSCYTKSRTVGVYGSLAMRIVVHMRTKGTYRPELRTHKLAAYSMARSILLCWAETNNTLSVWSSSAFAVFLLISSTHLVVSFRISTDESGRKKDHGLGYVLRNNIRTRWHTI